MAKNTRNFFNYGWIVDEDHPIKPKAGKGMLIDLAVGAGITALGIGYMILCSFHHGAHGYEKSQLDILNETGKIDYDGSQVTHDAYSWKF